MTSHLPYESSRTAKHPGRRVGLTGLLFGLALLTVLLIANQAGAQPPDRVHTAIVMCECPDPASEGACEPLVLDSSFTPAPAVETACDPDNEDATCAKCLAAVASQMGANRLSAPLADILLPDILTYTLITAAGPGGGPHVVE